MLKDTPETRKALLTTPEDYGFRWSTDEDTALPLHKKSADEEDFTVYVAKAPFIVPTNLSVFVAEVVGEDRHLDETQAKWRNTSLAGYRISGNLESWAGATVDALRDHLIDKVIFGIKVKAGPSRIVDRKVTLMGTVFVFDGKSEEALAEQQTAYAAQMLADTVDLKLSKVAVDAMRQAGGW